MQFERNSKGQFVKGSGAYWKGKKFPAWYKEKLSKVHKRLYLQGKNLPPSQFKGEDVSYKGLHLWINNHFERVDQCENCGGTENLDWANKTGLYNRERDNWFKLCRKCHYSYDRKGFLP